MRSGTVLVKSVNVMSVCNKIVLFDSIGSVDVMLMVLRYASTMISDIVFQYLIMTTIKESA